MKLLPLLTCLGSLMGVVLGGDQISCRFVGLDGASPIPALVVAGEKGEEVAITVSSGSISQPVICETKANAITFYSAADKLLAGTASIPAKTKAAILVFSPTPKDQTGSPWKVTVIDDSPKSFADGGALIANFCNQDTRFIIGKNTLTLKQGESLSVARPKERDDFNMATVASQYQKGGTWVNSSESMLRFLPGMRYIMFSYPDSASGVPKLLTIQDSLPLAPSKR